MCITSTPRPARLWKRENRVYNAAAVPLIPAPFRGTFPDRPHLRRAHPNTRWPAEAPRIALIATAALPANSVNAKLYRVEESGAATLVAEQSALTGPAQILTVRAVRRRAVRHLSGRGVPGRFVFSLGSLPPLPDFLGALVVSPIDTSVTSVLLGADANAPQWKWFPTNPSQHYDGEDVRKVACSAPLPEGGLSGCDIDVTTTASRGPWDLLLGTVPTFTTIGNNAITAGGADQSADAVAAQSAARARSQVRLRLQQRLVRIRLQPARDHRQPDPELQWQ